MKAWSGVLLRGRFVQLKHLSGFSQAIASSGDFVFARGLGAMQSQAERIGAMESIWVESARDCVRNHPLASIAGAVAAGMLLGRMLSR